MRPKADLTFLIFLSFSSKSTNSLARSKKSTGTSELICNDFAASFTKRPISGTYLETGQFYKIRMKYSVDGHRDGGYVTWDWISHGSSNEVLSVTADDNNMEQYEKGGDWYEDTHWTFLASKDPDWYHLLNCGYFSRLATFAGESIDENEYYSDEESKHGKGYPLILEPMLTYPGNHSKEDYLFRPVMLWNNDQEAEDAGQTYQLITKVFDVGIVFNRESDDSAVTSDILVVESNQTYFESKGDLENTLFIITSELGEGENNDGSDNSERFIPLGYQETTCNLCSTALLGFLIVWAGAMTCVNLILVKKHYF